MSWECPFCGKEVKFQAKVVRYVTVVMYNNGHVHVHGTMPDTAATRYLLDCAVHHTPELHEDFPCSEKRYEGKDKIYKEHLLDRLLGETKWAEKMTKEKENGEPDNTSLRELIGV